MNQDGFDSSDTLHNEHNIHDLQPLRNRSRVFKDRVDAGQILAHMLERYRDSDTLVLAIPAGGVPVAAQIAERLHLALDVAVVSKVLLPWTTEAGYGAVAFDGSVWINRADVVRYGLSDRQVADGTQAAQSKVTRRLRRFRGNRPSPQLANRPVLVVDDGLAAGSTMHAAVEALHNQGAAEIIVAVPTAPLRSLRPIAAEVTDVYCANVRTGLSFAVADAYARWSDVGEDEVAKLLAELHR